MPVSGVAGNPGRAAPMSEPGSTTAPFRVMPRRGIARPSSRASPLLSPALAGYPDVSGGVRGGGRIYVRSGGVRNSHCCAGLSVLDHACPDVEIRLGVCGPKHPRAAFAIDCYGWAAEISTGSADGDWL